MRSCCVQVSSAVQTVALSSAVNSCAAVQLQPVSLHVNCTAHAGSQTESPALDAATVSISSRAVQTVVTSTQDAGSHADTRGAADKCVKADSIATGRPVCNDRDCRPASAALKADLASSAAAHKLILQTPAPDVSSHESAMGRADAATGGELAAETAPAATWVNVSAQTEEILPPGAASGRGDAMLDAFLRLLSTRQQFSRLSAEQRPGFQGRSAEAQADSLQVMQPPASPLLSQSDSGPAGAGADPDILVTAPLSRRLSLGCIDTLASAQPAVPTAAEQLALADMEAAAAHHSLTDGALRDGVILAGRSSRSEDHESLQHQSLVTSACQSADMLSAPSTPRRHIHRRLWRSGRTDEWADLLAVHCDECRTPGTSFLTSAADEGRSSIGDLFSFTTSSDSASGSSKSEGRTSPSAPVAHTVACQTSVSRRDDVNVCDADMQSCSSCSVSSGPSDAPSARLLAACQAVQTGREVTCPCRVLQCTDLGTQSSDSGEISAWLTSLSLTAS